MTQSYPVKPLMLGGGVYLSSTQYDHTMHLDHAHLKNINQKHGIAPTDLGVIEYFYLSGFLDDMGSIFNFNQMGKNVIEVEGDVYTYKVPESYEDFYIVEDLSTHDKPGIDEQTFKLRFNTRMYGNTAVLTHSKFSKFDLVVTHDEIVKDGDTWIYTVKLKGQGAKTSHFPKQYLEPGTRFTQKSSMMGEFGTVYNDQSFSSKMATFYNYVGQTKANHHFVVTDEAAEGRIAEGELKSLRDYQQVLETYIFRAGSDAMDYQLRGIDPIKKIYKGDVKAAQKDIVASSWVPLVEALAMKRITLDVEQEAFWGTGGTYEEKGRVYYSPIGLYQQFNRGNQHFFNIDTLSIDKIDGILASFFNGRQRPFGTNVIELEVGDGFFSIVRRLLQNLPSQMGMITNSEKYLSGASGNEHFATPVITSYDFTFGTVRFNVNPALNPVVANEIENPYIGAYRLSSYMAIVTDVTGQNDNIKELRSKSEHDFVWQFENGKYNYMGTQQGFQGRLDVPWGFRVGMRKKHKAYWLQDPTRAFIMKPYNPLTKKPFGEL